MTYKAHLLAFQSFAEKQHFPFKTQTSVRAKATNFKVPRILQRWEAPGKSSRRRAVHLRRRLCLKSLVGSLFIGSFGVVPLLGILLQQEADIVDSMPTGAGKRTVVRICSECHSLGNVVNQRNMTSGWEAIIDEMTIRGAQIFADERKMVVAYLDKYFGLDRSEREALMKARYECLF